MALDRSWRLWIDRDSGKVRGSKTVHGIEYNTPFPCPNGRMGVTTTMRGVIEHTMVGSLAGTIKTFNDPDRHASAHFGVSQAGLIHQFGPIGHGWEAFHAYEANLEFYGIEFEDYKAGQDPDDWPRNPISDHALTAGAQLIEVLSRFAGFPLWLMVNYTGQGLGYHREFTPHWNWSYHSCPGASFEDNVRVNQRGELIRRARLIRG